MSKRAASHSGGIRSEAAAKNRRVVFKNVLDTPFNIQWPEVKGNDCTVVLDMLCEMLAPIREYRSRDGSANNKEESDTGVNKKSKKRKRSDSNANEKPNTSLATSIEPPSTNDPGAPPILAHTFIGINSVTRLLEKSIQAISDHPMPAIVFVCKGDLSPAHLYNHLATMAALLPSTLLFPLPKGAEAKLSTALGLRAVGAIGFKAGNREVDDIVMVSSRMVDPVTTSWLPKITPPPRQPTSDEQKTSTSMEMKKTATSVPATTPLPYEQTKIKSVQTTAPIVSKNDRTVKPKKESLTTPQQKEQQSGQKQKGQKGQQPGHKGQQSGQPGHKGQQLGQPGQKGQPGQTGQRSGHKGQPKPRK